MQRKLAALACSMAVLGPSAARCRVVAEEPPPPLTPPVLSAPIDEPPAELPPLTSPLTIPRPENRRNQVLVVPGVTTPRPGRPLTFPGIPRSEAASPAPFEGLPPLVGPAEMAPPARPAETGRALPATPRDPGRRPTGLPPLIESEPTDTIDRRENSGEARERASSEPTIRRGLFGPRDHGAESGVAAGARRPTGLFGRFFPPPAMNRSPSDLRNAVTVEPRTDPASDAALKRRVERQIRETVGDRARSFDVRVMGRDVTIIAHGVRLFQRRAVRSTLENLPALSGYKAFVQLLD